MKMISFASHKFTKRSKKSPSTQKKSHNSKFLLLHVQPSEKSMKHSIHHIGFKREHNTQMMALQTSCFSPSVVTRVVQ